MTDKELVLEAIEARKNAYAPYSNFCVGAALLTKDGSVIRGCNIENAAYGPSNCAERTAFFKAISEGINSFEKIAVVGGKREESGTANNPFSSFATPCGVCRQVMREFCSLDFKILVAKSVDEIKGYTLDELLPDSFGPENLK